MENTPSNNATHQIASQNFTTLFLRVNHNGLPCSKPLTSPKQEVIAAALCSLIVRLFPGEQVDINLENQPHGITLTVLPAFTLNQVLAQLQSVNQSAQTHSAALTLRAQHTHTNVTLEVDPLFYSATLQSWIEQHVNNYIARVMLQPDQALSHIHLLSHRQCQSINEQLNPVARHQHANPGYGHQVAPRHNTLLQQLFAEQVATSPNSVAVEFAGETLSYKALDTLSNALKQSLLNCYCNSSTQLLAPDTTIALIFERSPAWIISILAVLKAGGAYVPLDPAYPTSRLQYMLQDSAAKLVIGTAKWLDRLNASHSTMMPWQNAHSGTRVEHPWLHNVCVQVLPDHPTAQHNSPSHSAAERQPNGNNLAYIIYTSGSTGKPKGVAVEHLGACALAKDLRTRFALKPGIRMLQFASPSFDASVFEWAGALCSGATLVVAGSTELPPEKDIADTLAERHIHITMLPPSVLRTMKNRPLPHLQWLLSGGEPCSSDIVQKWYNNAELARPLVNVYGPTEATVLTTAAYLVPHQPVSIGKAIANRRVAIVNSWLEMVPEGACGELCVLGCGVARGYLNSPPAAVNFITAEQITGLIGTTPTKSSPHNRGYRTGDFVRQSPNHNIEYIGRRDKQIKVRGFRIELGEIEAAIMAHQEVKETAVVLCKQQKTTFIVAFVCIKPDEERKGEPRSQHTPDAQSHQLTEQALTEFLRQQLPSHMLPRRFYFEKNLPLTPNGKIDRDALTNLAQTSDEPATITDELTNHAGSDPHLPYQQILTGIWRDVLGQPHIAATDNFYALGGDSIIAIQVIGALETQGLALNASDFVANPSIRELARHVTRKHQTTNARLPNTAAPNRHANTSSHTSTFPQPEINQPFNLSPIQQWLFEQNPAAIAGFCQYQTLRIRQFNAKRFAQALNKVVHHHDAFRQCFVADTSPPHRMQRVYQASAPEITLEPLAPVSQSGSHTGHESAQEQSKLERTLKSTLERWFTQFSPETGHLVRAGMLNLNEHVGGETLVVIAIHHLVIDGVSWRLLLNQLQNCYQQPDTTLMVTPSQMAIQQAMQRYARHPETAAQLSYWQSVLSQSAQLYQHSKWVLNQHSAPQPLEHLALSAPLQKLHNSASNNLQFLPLLGAFALSLQQLTGNNAVALVTEGHGREPFTDVNFERNIGWFTSMFPVFLTLPLPPHAKELSMAEPNNWKAIWQQLQQQWQSVPDNGLSYGALRYLNPETQSALAHPVLAPAGSQQQPFSLPPVVFNFLGVFHQQHNENWVAFDNQSGQDATQHPLGHSVLELNCAVVNGELACHFSYNPTLFEQHTINAFYARFLRFTAQLCTLSQQSGDASQYTSPPNYSHASRTFGLTATQQGMLFHTLANPQLDNYLVQTLWDYPCAIHPQAMEQAWQKASRQQAVFRTAYEWHNRATSPQQRLCHHSGFAFHWHNIRHLTPQQQQQEIARIIKTDRAQPFDLSRPGPLRAYWFALGEQHCQLLLSHHHIVLDGWSLSQLLNAIDHLYHEQLNPGEQPAQPSPVPSVKTFIDYAQHCDLIPAKAFFEQALAQAEISTRLVVHGQASDLNELKPITNQHTVEQEISAAVTTALLSAAKHNGVTLGALIMLAAGLVQSANDNGADTVFGTILSGRNHLPELAHTPGMLASTLPVIFRPEWQQALPQALQAMHVLLGELNRHSLLPLRDISDKRTGKPVRFTSLITFENYPGQERGPGTEKAMADKTSNVAPISKNRSLLKEIENTAYPLTLVFRPFNGKLESKISYDADVFNECDINVLQQQLSCVLEVIAEHAQHLQSLTCEALAEHINKKPNAVTTHQPSEQESRANNMIPTQESTAAFTSPLTAQQRAAKSALETVWKEVLGVASVSPHDNYFALGGDSLNALQIMNALEQHGYRLSAPDVLQNPEFQQMLQLLCEQAHALPDPSASVTRPVAQKPYPLAPTQLRFFSRFFNGQLTNPHFFTIPVFSQLKQAVNTEHLARAIDAALAVSDAHHVKFIKGDGIASIRQIPHRWQPEDYFRVVDLSENKAWENHNTLSSQARQQQIIQQVAEDASQSMNIWHGALFRIVAFTHLHQHGQHPDTQSPPLLFIVFHHLVSDGMSVNVFLHRLSNKLLAPTPSAQLPQKRSLDTLQPGCFLPWADALHHYASVHDWRAARYEWQRIMTYSATTSDKPAQPNHTRRVVPLPTHADMSVFEQPLLTTPAESTALRKAAQQLKTTPFNLLLAAFLLGLQRIERHHSTLHIMGAQRHIPAGLQTERAYMGDLNQCMGFFSAAVPFTGSVAQFLSTNPHHRIDALLPAISQRHHSCNELALEYLILQYLLPFSASNEAAAIPEQHEILFHYFAADPREQESAALAPAQFASGPASDPQNQSNYLLNTTLIHTENQLSCRFYYAKDFICQTELEQLHGLLSASTAQLLYTPDVQTHQPGNTPHQTPAQEHAPTRAQESTKQ